MMILHAESIVLGKPMIGLTAEDIDKIIQEKREHVRACMQSIREQVE